MNDEIEKYIYKIIMIGDSNTGKTTLSTKYCYDQYIEKSPNTIGVCYLTKNIKENNRLNKITIWDTAGQERFNSIVKVYFKNVHGAICMYDITKISTLYNAEKWIQQLLSDYKDEDENKPKIILVGNKIDISYKSINNICDKKEHFINNHKDFIDQLVVKYKLLDHYIISSKYENIDFIYDKLYKNIENPIKIQQELYKKKEQTSELCKCY